MIIVCAFVIIIILAINIFYELKDSVRDVKKSKKAHVSRQIERRAIKRNAVYDWNNENKLSPEKSDTPKIIDFESILQKQKESVFESQKHNEVLDACTNIRRNVIKHADGSIFIKEIKNA